ncbi:MAG: asparagine--tRNA ligase, partial [Candidatus Heimdallarchaeota archaeon]|nr:asparagine--tRNA ligase [Candidatus Heimdallarchaeota archaeon]MCK4877718.1 asparagine--tRNA ligase [Candidatus Heimdallarchaeota archaeon]
MPEVSYTHASKVIPSDKTVLLRGWVYRIRKMKDKIFVVLRDASGIVQCVGAEDQLKPEAWNALNETAIENAIHVEGKPVEDNRAVNNVEIR